MKSVGIDIQELARKYKKVILILTTDGAATCELVLSHVAWLVSSKFENVNIILNGCQLHSLNRVTTEHIVKSGFDLATIFSLSKIMRISTYWDSLIAQATRIAIHERRPHWQQFGGPAAADIEAHEAIFALTLPKSECQKEVARVCREGMQDLSGCWLDMAFAHVCTIDANNIPCCVSFEEALEKIKRGVVKLCWSQFPPEPVVTRWLTCVVTAGWYLRGLCVHRLLPRAYIGSFANAGEALNVSQAVINGPINGTDGDDDIAAEESQQYAVYACRQCDVLFICLVIIFVCLYYLFFTQDNYHVKTGKRLRRGKRKLVDTMFAAQLVFSLILLSPLHRIMAELVSQSEVGCCILHEIVSSINNQVMKLIELGSQDLRDGSAWLVMRNVPAVHVPHLPADRLGQFRKEFLRVVAGVELRIAGVYKTEVMRLMLAAEACEVGPCHIDDLALFENMRQELANLRKCCAPPEHANIIADPPSLQDARKLKRVIIAGIMANERAHSGNRKRCKGKQTRALTWRRQVGTHIVVCSKNDYANRSVANKRRLRMLSSVSFEQFKAVMAPVTSRSGIGGNKKRTYTNAKLKGMKGRGCSRDDVVAARRRHAQEYNNFREEQLDQRPSEREKVLNGVDIEEEHKNVVSVQREQTGILRELAGQASADDDGFGEVADPNTHCAMGSNAFPLQSRLVNESLDVVARQHNIQRRGGLRIVSGKLLPESTLVTAPTGKRLQIPKSFREVRAIFNNLVSVDHLVCVGHLDSSCLRSAVLSALLLPGLQEKAPWLLHRKTCRSCKALC